jgi:hypothetical protein
MRQFEMNYRVVRGDEKIVSDGAEETQIEDSFCVAVRIAKDQKSVSLRKRAEATFAELPSPKSERLKRPWVPGFFGQKPKI